jgi:DNA-binding NtrC family response regulator
VLARGPVIELDDLLVEASDDPASGAPEATAARGAVSLRDFLDAAAAERIRAALAETGGRRTEAAARLGIERTTLYRLMRRYGVDAER